MSRVMRIKLARDLRANWTRLALMVIAISVTLTVFGAVLSARAGLDRETTNAYASTGPASATIVLDAAIDEDLLAALAEGSIERDGVLSATARGQFNTPVTVNGAPRLLPLQVFVARPDDAMRIARFDLGQEGAWPPARDEIWLGEDTLTLIGIRLGDTVTIQTPSGSSVSLRVGAAVYDPSLAPSPQEQRGRAYVATDSLYPDGATAPLDQLKIHVAAPGETAPSRDRDAIVPIATSVATWLRDENGVAVREVQVPEPYAHPHQFQADVLLASLVAGGAAALLLSAILVGNMLNNLFTQQIPQIGILKAIGASTRRIARQYLAMTSLIAALATALAILPAMLLGQLLLGEIVNMLAIKPETLAPPLWTLVTIVATGLILPTLMCLPPILKASRTTVRAAIGHRGASAKPSAATDAVARLSRRSRIDRGMLLALRNTTRRPARFWLAVGLLASAGAVFIAGMSLGQSMDAVGDEQKVGRAWDVEVQLGRPTSLANATGVLTSLSGIERIDGLAAMKTGVAATGSLPVTRTYPDQGHGSVSIVGIPAGSTMFIQPLLSDGRWLDSDETGAVVLGDAVRDASVPDVRAGDLVELYVAGKPTSWRVVGIASGHGNAVYTTTRGLAEATGMSETVNQLRVAIAEDDEPTRQAFAQKIETALEQAGIPVASSASVSRADTASEGHVGLLSTIILAIAVAMGIVGIIGLASTMSANVLDRTREFGIMHAVGASPAAVRRIVVIEGALIALASCVVAILPALGLARLLGIGLGDLFYNGPLPYRVSGLAIIVWTFLVGLGSVLATEAAAARASRPTIREALTTL